MRFAAYGGDDLCKWVIFSLVFMGIVACGGNDYRAPVEDRRQKAEAAPATYSVQRGDTLFSISWRYGLDFRTVATNNRIASPYTIYPGQKIYLTRKAPVSSSSASRKTSTSVKKTPTAPSTASSSPVASSKPPTVKSTPKPSSNSSPGPTAAVSKWMWPTAGRVTRNYSTTVHKGIDIAGSRGDAILAVAAGKVVYAGAGIVGYGELLIVKHNEVYLSAYGHNDRLLVSEGENVKAGQKIATKGSSGTDTVKLHFEIRREGKPIDPKKLLPPR